MKRQARLLFTKAVDSLVLAIEHYNRPWDRGRVDAVLILLDHAFKMLLKAGILHRGGAIRKPREKQTLGFDECLHKALSDGAVKILEQEQVLQLQAINTLRDAAQHHLVDLSEPHLYIHAQAGLTLFRDVVRDVFGQDLKAHLPPRVLPLSTTPPTDLATLFAEEAKEVERLLKPGKRRKVEAPPSSARSRSSTARGAATGSSPPTAICASWARRSAKEARGNRSSPAWPRSSSRAQAPARRSTCASRRRKGFRSSSWRRGRPGATVVAVHKVDALGFYNLGRNQIATHFGLTGPRTTALIQHAKIKDDPDCFRRITIGKTSFDRYSQKAIERLREALETADMKNVWAEYQAGLRRKARA